MIQIVAQAVFAKIGLRTVLKNDSRSILCALLTAQGAQINPELLRFLIQVTALEAKSFCSQTHILMSALQFGQNGFALE